MSLKADFKELIEFRNKLEKMANSDINEFCIAASKEMAARMLALVIPRTPVGKKPEFDSETVTIKSGKKEGQTRKKLTVKGRKVKELWEGYIGGTLRRGWVSRTHEEAVEGSGRPTAEQGREWARKLPVFRSGNNYRIILINPVEWASYVEYGHRQKPGRYVPALGKKLVVGFVLGQFFLEKSEEKLEKILPGILEKKLQNFLMEALSGKN